VDIYSPWNKVVVKWRNVPLILFQKKEGAFMLLSTIITEKKKKRDSKQDKFYKRRNLEEKMENLKEHTIIDYYLNGGY